MVPACAGRDITLERSRRREHAALGGWVTSRSRRPCWKVQRYSVVPLETSNVPVTTCGDEAAAHIATDLSALVSTTARRRGGRPIRWLGDGGMFLFREPGAAVLAGVEMVETTPLVGLPPMHIGIHTGSVVFQDGDVYGRTVNLASRIASHAKGP